MPFIDLSDPALATKIDEKAKTLAHIADHLVRANMISAEMVLPSNAPIATARAYWLLNLAFKDQQMDDETLTNEQKRAAIQACATMAVRPFTPRSGTPQLDNLRSIYANPHLALIWGASVIGSPPISPTIEEERRICNIMLQLRFPSLSEFLADVNSNAKYDPRIYEITLSDRELSDIDVMILQFESLTHRC